MKKIEIHGIKILYNNKNISIKDAYKVPTEYFKKHILVDFLKETNFKSKRTIESWTREWNAHNRLYNLGLFKNHTKDCDLEEDESKIRLLIYNIIGR